ncbi:MAG: phage tail protein [Tannerella sp.]|jgi:hypothetical protein|nr:phage tail protein [Tannerella sp.]
MTAIKHDSEKDILRGQLFLFVDGKPIAFGSSASLEASVEEIDVSNKMMGGWKASLPGKKGFTVSSESLMTRLTGAESYDSLLDRLIAGKTMEFVFGEALVTEETNLGGKFDIDLTKKHYTGVIMITSLSLTSENGQIATSSASFVGVGALVPVAGTP